MLSFLQHRKLHVKNSTIHGLGVFAGEKIRKGQIIEKCHYLIVDHKYKELSNYLFDGGDKHILVLGFGSIYNHSASPNADYEKENNYPYFVFRAIRDIKKNEEILIDYGSEWFNHRNITIKSPTTGKEIFKLHPINQMLLRFAIIFTGLLAFIKYFSHH